MGILKEAARAKAIRRLKKLQANGDIERDHAKADETLCQLLKSLGYKDVVDEYNKIDKWYA